MIGQNSTTTNMDDMEDLRERMRAENALVVIGGADNQLRMSRAKRKQEGITQIVCDKKILVNFYMFYLKLFSMTYTKVGPDKVLSVSRMRSHKGVTSNVVVHVICLVVPCHILI